MSAGPPPGHEHDRPRVAIFPPLLFAICLGFGVAAHRLCPDRFEGAWTRWLGGIVALAAIALGVWGERTMSAAGTAVRPDKPSTTVVTGGPFAFSRNPLYLAIIGVFVGLGLALASPAFLVVVVPLVAVLRYGVISREERYLEAKFGSVYRDYRDRVRRWV